MRPTAYRRNARGLRARRAFEGVRMQAGELFAAGRSQAQVAHPLGVARQNVSRWQALWRAGGLDTDHWTLERITTVVIRHHFKWKRCSMAATLCYGSCGGGAAVAFCHQLGAYNTQTLIDALGELRRALGGQKATLLWDGLPAHRSLAMAAWLQRQRHWLVVEPLPGYAPDLNPVEALWASLKGVELANLAGDTLEEVIAAAERGIQRIQRIQTTHWLAFSFLRRCGLSLW